MTTVSRNQSIRPTAIAPNLKHSALTGVGVHWSPGQGVRPPPGGKMHLPGLYLSAKVHAGHHLQLDSVKVDKTSHTVTIRAGARGQGAPGKGAAAEEKFVRGGFSMKAEKWTVVVQDDAGKVLMKKAIMLGGPPAA